LLARAQALLTPETWPLGSPPAETLLELELCELEALRASANDRADGWSALADRWERLGRPLRGAYARLREGQAALGEDLSRDRVKDALLSADAAARKAGAQPLLEEIELVSRRLRVRTGGQTEAPADAAGLTARELDVLRLIAQGRTNPEIGQALYMSPKTASVHVSRILAKLDVKTRTEAVGTAHRLGLLEA
jgi:DNA-binding CsgD family transcriptional regulator